MTLEAILAADIHAYDVDMTLVDSAPVLIAAFREYASQNYGVDLPGKFIRKRLLAGTPEEMIEAFREVLEAQGKALKGEARDDVPRWQESYMRCDVRPSIYPGTVDMLRLSKQMGKKVLLITSGMAMELERNACAILECAANQQLWDATVCYEEIVRKDGALGKPNPYPMEIGLRKMGVCTDVSQHRIAYVGDSLSDMLFARNIEATGVLLETTTRTQDIECMLGFAPLAFRSMQAYYGSVRDAL